MLFFIRSVVETKSNEHPHATVASLNNATRLAMAANPQEARRACGRFRHRLELVQATQGGHIE